MSHSPATLLEYEESLNAHFLQVVQETIAKLTIWDQDLRQFAESCDTADQWIHSIFQHWATEQEVTRYKDLFDYPDDIAEHNASQERLRSWFAALERDVGLLLKDLGYREQRTGCVENEISLQLSSMSKADDLEIVRIVYEKDPFVLMEVRSRRSWIETLRTWVRYNHNTKAYKEVELSDLDLLEKLDGYSETSKEPVDADKVSTAPKGPSDQGNTRAITKFTTDKKQTEPGIRNPEPSRSTPNKTIPKTTEEEPIVTINNDEADWEIVQAMEDVEIDMVLVR